MGNDTWSSRIAFYFVSIGAAVGLGTVWRFPYLAGQYGGGFILIFILVCVMITTPILAAEFVLGRRGRGSPPAASHAVATSAGLSPAWSTIGWLGTMAMFLIMTYYSVIGGWVLAYIMNFARGNLADLNAVEIGRRFEALLADPWGLAFWHTLFMAITAGVSAAGLERGIELANKIMIPGLFALLIALVGYSIVVGDFERALPFLLRADWASLDASLVISAIGQAFYATGVGMGIMMAYGSYVPREVSLLRSGAVISSSIIIASVLASLVIFPLAFRYGVDPAQGPQLAFVVLPTIFSDMPGGQIAGFAFFVLLAFAALSSAVAGLEPSAGVLRERFGWSRRSAVFVTGASMWLAGLAVVLSFNHWKDVRPLAGFAYLSDRGIFDLLDYTSANILLPVGALLTCLLVAWRLPVAFLREELGLSERRMQLYRAILGVLCPLAIVAIFIASL
ncbi:MAG TPA: sodium-dependent transporter [Steroidobacteraceae bacterium]